MRRRIRRGFKKLRRYVKRRPIVTGLLVVGVAVLGVVMSGRQSDGPVVDPIAYRSLLDTVGQGESSGNYNAYYGHSNNQDPRFTDMTIAQVLQWQDEYVRQGSPSSAVGRYQIMRSTLTGLVQRLNLDTASLYDEAMQDRLAIALFERRGALDFVSDKLSRQQFAANIAMEWAALPRAVGQNPQDSYYAGDGLNESRVSLDEVLKSIDELGQAAQ